MTTSHAETTVAEPAQTPPAPPRRAAIKKARVPKPRQRGWPTTLGVLGVVVFCLAPFY